MILFISTMHGSPWGGSEELWSRAALLLSAAGVRVSASVVEWSPLHHRLVALREAGIAVHTRRPIPPIWRRGLHRLTRAVPHLADIEIHLARAHPDLVVISNGGPLPSSQLARLCVAQAVPFVTIGQANSVENWPGDDEAGHLRRILPKALRCYFVSEGNLRLAEKQIGMAFANAELVRNPFNVPFDAAPPWPAAGGAALRLASVGRLHAASKGQDLLLEALAAAPWQERDWHLSFFGDGPNRGSLTALADRLGLAGRVTFAGHVDDIVGIWSGHHALALPSRYEGLPLALVEAMLCGRPAIATDVAGHAEIVEDGVTGFLAESASVPAFGRALESLWARRADLAGMGQAAARRIRELVPSDPARVFADKLMQLASSGDRSSKAAGAP